MTPFTRISILAISVASLLLPSLSRGEIASEDPKRPDEAFFEKKIRPLLANSCYTCHSAETKPDGGLRVDDRHGLLAGGDSGPAVVPGDPENSLLLQRIRHENPKRRMPKEGDLLTEEQIADLTAWIAAGAPWPAERVPASIGRVRAEHERLKATHWAWQPLERPSIPEVQNSEWPRTEIDRFILAKLEANDLPPVEDADRLTLIRRITYDLTGLPPTREAIEEFTNDPSPDAVERLVDRLLASRLFAEHWGRHWLDVARYGESTGPSRNIPYPHAWKYRDYVIEAFQRDVPYDRFIQEQIAGDLLPAETPAERDRLAIATGFLALGVKDVNQRFKVRFTMDNVDEKIDTVSRSVLGLTVSCARCHDHKFDPVSVTDYYALAGIFTSTHDGAGVRNKMGGGGLDYYVPSELILLTSDVPPVPAEEVEKKQAEVEEAKAAWHKIRNTPEGRELAPNGRPKQRVARLKFERLQAELLALTDPADRGFAAHGVRDAEQIGDTEIRIRGEAERLGPKVPRGFLSTFEVPGAAPVNPEQSGRLELAHWLTSPKNPLTPRVIANRVWQHLFGQGIVSTVDNFGVTGDVPSHPELLDYLATEFIREGWSIKKLIRTIVISRAYQLGTAAPEVHRQKDPANKLVWRHSPRRLTAEEIRDSILAAAGKLKFNPPEASPAKALKMVEIRDNGAEARKLHEAADQSVARSIYLPLLRGITPKALEAFDPVQQTLVTGQRDETTVPGQALFLLNSVFVGQQSKALAEQIVQGRDRFDAEWLEEVYLRILGRKPDRDELLGAALFLGDMAGSHREFVTPAQPETLLAATPVEKAPAETSEDDAAGAVNPDDIDRTDEVATEGVVRAEDPKTAAWMTLVQSLFASAEFRFVR